MESRKVWLNGVADPVRVGDRIKFKAACREGAFTVTRKINGFDGWLRPTVRYRGYSDFVVKPSEIIEVLR